MMHTSPAHKTFFLSFLLSLLLLLNSFRSHKRTLQHVHGCSTGEVAASCEVPNERRSFNNFNTNDKGAVLHSGLEAAGTGRDLVSRDGDVPWSLWQRRWGGEGVQVMERGRTVRGSDLCREGGVRACDQLSLRPSRSFSASSTAIWESSGRFCSAVQMAVAALNAVSLTNLRHTDYTALARVHTCLDLVQCMHAIFCEEYDSLQVACLPAMASEGKQVAGIKCENNKNCCLHRICNSTCLNRVYTDRAAVHYTVMSCQGADTCSCG
jgi:hypothetical protein